MTTQFLLWHVFKGRTPVTETPSDSSAATSEGQDGPDSLEDKSSYTVAFLNTNKT